jgi:hypothetical protein
MQNGVYRHYKGKLYYVVGVARQTETNEELVIYIPLYRHQDGGIPLQARPKTMFSGMVDLADGPALASLLLARKFRRRAIIHEPNFRSDPCLSA